ncbi:MAG: hypothetical protein M3Y55_14995 [Pseudomonadota bacterium]|nr:hypothetical protein [Pseudomonadota bacterium]
MEQIIATHDDVENVAVFPVSTPAGDEEVGAAIVARTGVKLSPLELIDYCGRNMSYFMVPRYVDFPAKLPLTANLKVEKFRLRAAFEADLDQVWDRELAGIKLAR